MMEVQRVVSSSSQGQGALLVISSRGLIPEIDDLSANPLNAVQNSSQSEDKFPPPKTDKPRPHVCTTCERCFARLEHLKRHERSHTKEKPFECPECSRCFARRDLLLRHQQKLHQTAIPASRQRNARRESTSSMTASGSMRVRKSSAANNAVGGTGGSGVGSMRPRANTISHVDNATLGMLAAANASARLHEAANFDLNSLSGVGGYNFRGMSTASGHHGNHHVLPKLETNGLKFDANTSLRTAPPYGGMGGGDVEVERMWFGAPFGRSTVNPAELHYSNSPTSMAYDTPTSPYQTGFPSIPAAQISFDEDGNFGWRHGFENSMSFDKANEHAFDGSSPSIISTGSHSGLSEIMLDSGSNPGRSSSTWQNSVMSAAPPPDYSMDWAGSGIHVFHTGQLSPKCHMTTHDQYFSTPPPMDFHTPMSMYGLNYPYVHPPMVIQETPSNSAESTSSSNRQNSISSISTHSITDLTRQALLSSLTQTSCFAQSDHTLLQPQTSSPVSQGFANPGIPLPSTYDLQRYVAAYIQYFHPHLPFLHVPTLSFDHPAFTNELRASNALFPHAQSGNEGGGALILAMAAIGAVYEYELSVSKELFEMAKKMIELYLEEDQKVGLPTNTPQNDPSARSTPLWLVQAMLLNVVYGHNCGDKACTPHCGGLVSLTRAADLLSKPLPIAETNRFNSASPDYYHHGSEEVHMSNDDTYSRSWDVNGCQVSEDQDDWYHWKLDEGRKRTLYAVFVLPSLLISAYNHPPALFNKEIRLDLPCDEDLWAADSAEVWRTMGGKTAAEQSRMPFASTLNFLITASWRDQTLAPEFNQPFVSSLSSGDLPQCNLDLNPVMDIKPSTFGCLVLINALHNYVWETRHRQNRRPWTIEETGAMHAHFEPALKAWQALWAIDPRHSLERSNSNGCTPLSADCIPLLDLAYVRLFVNPDRPRETLWQKDFNSLANESAQGQHVDHSSTPNSTADDLGASTNTDMSSPNLGGVYIKPEPDSAYHQSYERSTVSSSFFGPSLDHERLLRKAAHHAANSLLISENLSTTLAGFDSRELPVQSSICAYECAQVLAEWVSVVQQRVGGILGILGKESIDYDQVPDMVLLDHEDWQLLKKIKEFLDHSFFKLADGCDLDLRLQEYGYGSKILLVVAQIFRRAIVWPGKDSFPLLLAAIKILFP